MENKELMLEDKTTYYYSNNQRIPLSRENSVYAVKFVAGRDARDGGLSRPAFKLLHEDSDNIGAIPNYNFQIYKASTDKMSGNLISGVPLIAEVRKLKSEPSIEYSAVAYRRQRNIAVSKIDDLMFATREFAVQFKQGITRAQIDQLNQQYNVQLVKSLDYAPNAYLLRAEEADGDNGPVALANIYYESGMTIFANPNFVQRRHLKNVAEKKKSSKTTTIADTIARRDTDRSVFLSRQWHLTTAKVTDAWTITKGSSEVKVAILDDGVDTAHPEFSGKIVAQHDFATGGSDANPKNADDRHGTACAGVAVASGVKAFGSAPGCSLIAVNTPVFLGSVEEADMFKWVSDQGADVISCSWGPEDGTGAVDPLADNVRAAIHYCVTSGRKGLGIPVFWAAGNGNESVSNDGYASNPDVIAVAASSSSEKRSWYSDFGPEVFLCAPSNGDKNAGEVAIFTTDRTGNAGYNPNPKTGALNPPDDTDYTDNFGGTSSATPLAAGIGALLISINPALKVSDIKQIFRDTCEKIDTAGGNYDSNGHSNFYGYGRVDALKAVEKARNFSSGGGGGTPTNTTQPSITAPSSINRTDAPPVFQVNKAGRNYYAIELAAQADLFNYAANSAQRNSSNFYASWEKEMTSDTPFTLPADVWNSLKALPQIYYRMHVADDNAWGNYGVTVSDENAGSAPFFSIAEGGSGGGTPTNSSEPSITAPSSVSSNDQPPVFQVNKGGRNYYAVELAAQADLFNYAVNSAQRNSGNFYGSWEKEMTSDTPFRLPADVWNSLKNLPQIYYRMHVADDNAWGNYGVTVSDENASSAPSFTIVGGGSSGGGGTTPDTGQISIAGPQSIGRNDAAPVFQIGKGGRNFYAVEVATKAELFDNANFGSQRNAQNFYASWQVEMTAAQPYTLPSNIWNQLKAAPALYYRVHVADDNAWSNYGASVADADYTSAPMIQIADGSRMSRNGKYNPAEKNLALFNLGEAKNEDESRWQK